MKSTRDSDVEGVGKNPGSFFRKFESCDMIGLNTADGAGTSNIFMGSKRALFTV